MLLSVSVSQEQTITPCERAEYDAEHSILRTEEMLEQIFFTKEEIREYAKCYHKLTGEWVVWEMRPAVRLVKAVIVLGLIISIDYLLEQMLISM